MFYQLSNMLPQIFRVSSTLTLTSKHWWVEMHHKQTNGDTFILTKTKLWQVVFLVFFERDIFHAFAEPSKDAHTVNASYWKRTGSSGSPKQLLEWSFQASRAWFWWQFYDIVTSATSAASIPLFPFKAAISECSSYGRMQNLVFGEVVLTRWYGVKMNEAWMWKHSIVY